MHKWVHFFFLLRLFEMGRGGGRRVFHVAQAGLELAAILLSHLPQCWDSRHESRSALKEETEKAVVTSDRRGSACEQVGTRHHSPGPRSHLSQCGPNTPRTGHSPFRLQAWRGAACSRTSLHRPLSWASSRGPGWD